VTLQGKPGQQVKLIYGDRLEGNDIDNTSNAQYIMDKEQNATFQTDIITLDEGRVRFSPSFVYHGFRYIKVLGLDRVPDRDEIVAVSVRTSFEKTGNFASSSRIINKLQKMSQASQEANFVGIPTDCPHREKNGWTGDLQLSVEQLLYNYDCEADLRKYQRDICLCQTESGQIPCIAPTAENVFGYLWGSGPAWDVAMFVIPHELFRRTGDIGIIKEYLPYLINYCEYLEGKKDDDGLVGYGLGDWNPPRQCEVKAAPLKLTDSLYYMYMNKCVSLFCQKLGMDASIYTARADEMRARIKKTFVKRSGKVADGGPCAEAAVIYFGVVKGEEKDKVFKRLLKTLKRDGYTMRFGILGSKYVFHVLCDNFRYDIALRMLKQSKYPSFANWIKLGAVTLWEDYEGTNSRNHYMYSDISAVFYKYIAGIDYEIRDGVQYNTIRVNRSCGERKAAADVMTPAGKLGIAQKRENGKLHVTLRLPPNSKSEFLFEDGTRAELPSAGEYEFDLINA
jgi:alpha-L-rhamnosidase